MSPIVLSEPTLLLSPISTFSPAVVPPPIVVPPPTLALDEITPVVSSITLLVESESTVSLVTDAVFVKIPVVVESTSTVNVTVAELPLAIIPRLHGRVVHPPCDELTLDNVTPAGRVSETITFVASLGPALFTVTVYTS